MSADIILAYGKIIGVIAAALDHSGILPRSDFAKLVQTQADETSGTEAAILSGIAEGIRHGIPDLRVIDGGKPPESRQ